MGFRYRGIQLDLLFRNSNWLHNNLSRQIWDVSLLFRHKHFSRLLHYLPFLWHISPGLHPFIFYIWSLSNGLKENFCIKIILLSLTLPLCSHGSNRNSVVFLLFFFFGSDVLGEACLARLPRWGGSISSACIRDNDLARLRMGKIIIYHVQSRSEFFGTKFRTKLRMWLYLALAPPSCVRGARQIQIKYVINITH